MRFSIKQNMACFFYIEIWIFGAHAGWQGLKLRKQDHELCSLLTAANFVIYLTIIVIFCIIFLSGGQFHEKQRSFQRRIFQNTV